LNSSCSLTDSDKDGLLDGVDKCPNEAGPPERQGCPVKDTDNDGVVDDRDECPTVKGLVELKGCPETPKEPGNGGVIVKNCQLKINQQVFFATNKSTIQPKSFKILSEVARTLRAYPQIDRLLIAGHTDNQPSRKVDNHGLSEDRANAVQRYLVENGGVEPSRLRTKGFGPDQPIDSNDTAKGRAANRRVEFIIDTPECNQLYGRQ
jgi:outer membrane protein OmpA-like peptidoglycan-associated protein